MTPNKRVLGLESGATKSEWVYLRVDDHGTTIVSSGHLPGANFRIVSEQAISVMLSQLPVEATHVGAFLAGCADAADRARLDSLVRARWPHSAVTVGSDRDSSLATAFRDGDGIVVISGTGSAVTGRRGQRFEKAGGRGSLLGDRGSGYAISLEGLRLALEKHDLSHKTSRLSEAILRHLALNNMEELESWAQSADKMAIANLMSVMFQAAETGDEDMRGIIEWEARTLARYTNSVARRLEIESPQVNLQGGVFMHQPLYVDLYQTALQILLPGANAEVCYESGAIGAAWLAARTSLERNRLQMIGSEAVISDLAAATTEQSNPRSVALDSLTVPQLIDMFIDEEVFVIDALRECREQIESAISTVSTSLKDGGRLFYVGAGTSGRLGVLDASEIPPTFGEPTDRVQGIIAGGLNALHRSVEGAEDDSTGGSLAVHERGVTAKDSVLGITASGRTPFVLGALKTAKEIGASTLLLTCNPHRQHQIREWDVEIDLPTGPELLTGSTRLKAGTATKLVLNMISTCSMVLLGRVSSNLMVDLKPTNTKLRDRAVRLVAQLRGCSTREARDSLENAGWNVRKALSNREQSRD